MSEAIFELSAVARTDMGKGASRRLRREQNALPGVIYGGEKEPQSITLKQNEVRRAISSEAFFSHILTLDVDGKKEKVILKDIQRHPFKIDITHMDFQRVDAKHAITKLVPLHFINEDNCEALKEKGAVLNHSMSEVEIKCLPQNLPEFIEVDVTSVTKDHALHLSDIKCPNGVEITALLQGEDHDLPIASIQIQRVEAEPAAEEAAAEEGEATEAPADEENKGEE